MGRGEEGPRFPAVLRHKGHRLPVRSGFAGDSLKRRRQIGRIAVFDQAVDGLKTEGCVYQRRDLAERVSGRMIHVGALALHLLPVGLRSGQGVIAVPHRVDHVPHGSLVFRELLRQPHGSRPGNRPSPDVAAALHQIEVVQQCSLKVPRAVEEPRPVVRQHQNVGELHRGFRPHLLPGRDPLKHRPFRGPDRRRGIRCIVVGLKVHTSDYAPAN